MKRPCILLAVYTLLQHSQPTAASLKSPSNAAKTVSQGQKLQGQKCKTVYDFAFPILAISDCIVGYLYKA